MRLAGDTLHHAGTHRLGRGHLLGGEGQEGGDALHLGELGGAGFAAADVVADGDGLVLGEDAEGELGQEVQGVFLLSQWRSAPSPA